MDTDIVEELIKRCFPECVIHPDFPGEFAELSKGSEREVLRKFQDKLFLLSKFRAPLQKTKWFEHLKHDGRTLYSLHLRTRDKNIRVLLSWDENGVLYLHPFYERAGKTNTSYKPHIEIAENRRNDDSWR